MSDGRGDTERGANISRERLDALAGHFDSTDAGDLAWEEEPNVTVRRPELEQVSIRLAKEDLAELKAQAARMGIGYTTLVRMVLRRHLREAKAS
jgi:predicted DNA binding CopG/RHH family protein